MASRSGSHSRRQRSREPNDDFPALPPRLPSLRSLAGRERDPMVSLASIPATRPSTRNWAAAASRRAERAERIRNLDENSQVVGEFSRVLDHAWGPSTSSRLSRQHQPTSESRTPNLDELDRSLDETNSHIRILLEMTNTSAIPPLVTPSTNSFSSQRTHEYMDDHRRSKRRRLDSERRIANSKPFRYGTYGQVEPGQLRMEIVSCDGGMFSNESSYAAENILKNDNSVYCTKGNRCNIVLRHQGGTAFTLQELIIQGPTSANYSHPIREGMVFVTMRQDEVLKRTAQYQIQYAPTAREAPWNSSDDRVLPERDIRQILSIRHHVDGSTSTRAGRSYFARAEEDEYRIAQMPREFATNVPNIGVTTECSAEHAEDGMDGRRLPRRTPNRIGSLPFENAESDDDDDDEYNNNNNNNNNTNDFDFEQFLSMSGRPSHTDPSSMTLNEAWEASANATQEAVRAVGGELLAPHARFFIEKKNSTCTIRFDPPVSGRFILLKMWNSHHDPKSNIDIQSVIARGYAGPRYFPSVDLR